MLYAEDYGGNLPASSGQSYLKGPEWTGRRPAHALRWGRDHDPDARGSIKDSPLWPYVNAEQVFKCPADRSACRVQGQLIPRVRSMAMNMWLNGPGWGSARGERGTGWRKFFKLDAITDPDLPRPLCFSTSGKTASMTALLWWTWRAGPINPVNTASSITLLPTTTVLEVFPLPMGTRKSSDGRIHGRCQSLLAVD